MVSSKETVVQLEYESGGLVKLNNIFSNPTQVIRDFIIPQALHLEALVDSPENITIKDPPKSSA